MKNSANEFQLAKLMDETIAFAKKHSFISILNFILEVYLSKVRDIWYVPI